jgi:predicted RND superfamily exporter protein
MGIDYGVYVFSRWREEATHQDDKILALKKSIKEIIPPTFEAAITTSAGFLCIYISQIKGAKILAFVSACRILIYLLLSRIFLPAIIKYFSKYLMKAKIWDFVDKIFYSSFDSFNCYTPFTTQHI